ncbi:MAG: pilin, partial [Acinetobacter sp.]
SASGSLPLGNGWGCEVGGTTAASKASKYVQQVSTDAAGVITVTTTTDSSLKDAGGKTIVMSPMKADGTNAMAAADIGTSVGAWKCGPGTMPTKYLPGSCRG